MKISPENYGKRIKLIADLEYPTPHDGRVNGMEGVITGPGNESQWCSVDWDSGHSTGFVDPNNIELVEVLEEEAQWKVLE